jgi:hypothetical protein
MLQKFFVFVSSFSSSSSPTRVRSEFESLTFRFLVEKWVENNPTNIRIYPSNIRIFGLMVLGLRLLWMLPEVRWVGFLPPPLVECSTIYATAAVVFKINQTC